MEQQQDPIPPNCVLMLFRLIFMQGLQPLLAWNIQRPNPPKSPQNRDING